MSTPRRIEVVDYDAAWPLAFEHLKARLAPALLDLALAIEHVGSTAVPGLAAKPIVDIDVVIGGSAQFPQVIERLSQLGYVHEGNLGIQEREAFRAPEGSIPHHLYVCIEGSLALRNHLAVRDYLRTHPDAAAAYAQLKREIVYRGAADAERYGHAKRNFLLSLLRAVGLSERDLSAVAGFNR